MPVGALVAGSSVASSIIGAKGAKKAAQQQQQGAREAIDAQRAMFDTIRGDLSPYNEAGQRSLNMLMDRLGALTAPITMDQAFLESTPGYQFARTQGLKAVQNSAAARGLGSSGAALKGAATFATGLADQTFGQQFQREMDQRHAIYNRLFGPAQLGKDAAAMTGQFGTAAGQGIASSILGGAQAGAAGTIGATNAAMGGMGNLSNLFLSNQLMKSMGMPGLFGGGSSGGMYAGTVPGG